MNLDKLKQQAQAAIDEQKIPACNLPVYAFRRHKADFNTACSPERILDLIACIHAADAMRAKCLYWHEVEKALIAYDAARTALGADDAD